MRGVSRWFFGLAIINIIIGMAWGIQMAATNNHTLAPAHAHLNLIGWVSFAIIGIYYHLIPNAADGLMAKVHFLVAAAGLVLIVPGIVQAHQQSGETLAKIGAILTLLGMVIFALNVLRSRT